jgi:hypothetical protein
VLGAEAAATLAGSVEGGFQLGAAAGLAPLVFHVFHATGPVRGAEVAALLAGRVEGGWRVQPLSPHRLFMTSSIGAGGAAEKAGGAANGGRGDFLLFSNKHTHGLYWLLATQSSSFTP